MFIITAVGVFVIKNTHTHTHSEKKASKLSKKSLRTTASFFASACSSLLVMRNLDQTLKIIYKTLAIEEKPAQSFNFSFQCQSHLLRNSLFAVSADVTRQPAAISQAHHVCLLPSIWNQSCTDMMGAAGRVECTVICCFNTQV